MQSLNAGASSRVSHELYVDLRKPICEIRASFRKSYKSLVNCGLRLWSVEVLESDDSQIWADFKALHFQAAERKTRSEESWSVQHKMLREGEAFLIHLRDPSGKMVGAGFFEFTHDEGGYSVAAYKRELFDKPLGHVVQMRAIEEFQKRGLRWYKIGARPYAHDIPRPTEKEISIAQFKQGFATHCFPCFTLQHFLRDEGNVRVCL